MGKLITRESKGSKLTIAEMDGNLTYLQNLGNGSNDPRDYFILINRDGGDFNKDYVSYFKSSFDETVKGIYFIGSVETSLKFFEATGATTGSKGLKDYPFKTGTSYDIALSASIETYLKFSEAMGFNGGEISPLSMTWGSTNFASKWCQLIENSNYFKSDSFTQGEFIDAVLDKGIVEVSLIGESSKLDYQDALLENFSVIETYIKALEAVRRNANLILPQTYLRLLDKGIVIFMLESGGILISSTENALTYFEYVNSPIERVPA